MESYINNSHFKSTDALFAKVKEDLYSFDAAGLIDEGKFYKDVQYILTYLGATTYIDAEQILDVENYQAPLPQGFKLLDALYRCTECDEPIACNTPGIVFRKLTFDHYPETQIPDSHVANTCPFIDYWSQSKDKIFNAHEYLLVERNNFIYSYNSPILLKPGNVNTRKLCSNNCANVYAQGQDNFSIQNNKVYTNFKEGTLYITYKSFPLDDKTNLPLIPDNPIVEKAIEDYIKYNIIKNLRTNGDADVAQLLPLYQADFDKSMGKAITESKTSSFASMVHQVRLVKKRLNIYQL